MNSHPQFHEVSGAATTGWLAEDLVYALGRLLHDKELTEVDRERLTTAQHLLEALARDESGERASTGHRLAADRHALGALNAAMTPSADADTQELARRLAATLERVL